MLNPSSKNDVCNQASWPSGIRLPLGQPWVDLELPRLIPGVVKNNVWPAAATHRQQGLVEVRESWPGHPVG